MEAEGEPGALHVGVCFSRRLSRVLYKAALPGETWGLGPVCLRILTERLAGCRETATFLGGASRQTDKQESQPWARLQGRLLLHGLLLRPAAVPQGEDKKAHSREEKGQTEGWRQHCRPSLPAVCPSSSNRTVPPLLHPPPTSNSQLLTRCYWAPWSGINAPPYTRKTCWMGTPAPPMPLRAHLEKPWASDAGAETPLSFRMLPLHAVPQARPCRAHLFSAGFTPTDREAMAVTVSASSFSRFWASTRE